MAKTKAERDQQVIEAVSKLLDGYNLEQRDTVRLIVELAYREGIDVGYREGHGDGAGWGADRHWR